MDKKYVYRISFDGMKLKKESLETNRLKEYWISPAKVINSMYS